MFSPATALTKIAGRLPIGNRGVSIAQVTILRSITLVVSVGTGLLTAAVLGPAGRGELAALIVAPQVLAGLATLGLHASLIYNIKADPQNEREYITINLLLTLLAGVAATAAGWFLEPLWLSKYSAGIVMLARVFLLVTPLITATFTFTAVLEARARFVAANQFAYLQGLCTLAALGGLALAKALTPATAAAAYAGPAVFAFVYLGVLSGYRLRPRVTLHLPLFGRLLHFGLRFYGADVLGTASAYLDQVVVAAMLPAAALGTYVVALSVSRLLTLLPASAATVLFPTLAARPTTDIADAVAATVRILGIVNVAAAVCLALLGPSLLTFFYGAKFAAAAGPLRILLISTIPANAVGLLYQSYAGSGRPGMVTVIGFIGFAVSLGLMVLLVPAYGTDGAAIAILVAAVVRLVCVLAGMPLFLGVRIPRLIVSRTDLAWLKGR